MQEDRENQYKKIERRQILVLNCICVASSEVATQMRSERSCLFLNVVPQVVAPLKNMEKFSINSIIAVAGGVVTVMKGRNASVEIAVGGIAKNVKPL